MADIVVYGAYGYTGELIVNEAREQGIQVILSGRNEEKLKKLSQESGFRILLWNSIIKKLCTGFFRMLK